MTLYRMLDLFPEVPDVLGKLQGRHADGDFL